MDKRNKATFFTNDGIFRRCNICQKIYQIHNFYPNGSSRGLGFSYKCKYCDSKDVCLRKRKYLEDGKIKRKIYPLDKHQDIWKKNNPEKTSAEYKIKALIYSGLIVRKNCVVCGMEKAQAHHPDYSKPYEIIWLCQKHHVAIHRKYEPLIVPSKFIENYIKNGKQSD